MAGDNRTEAPTPRRREEARKKGQVARSAEVTSVAVLFAGLAALGYTGGDFIVRYRAVAVEAFRQVGTREPNSEAVLTLAGSMLWSAVVGIAPLVIACLIAGTASSLVQVGPMLSLQPLRPDVSRINPLKGLQRLWSPRSLVELTKAVAKVTVTGFVAYQVIKEQLPTIVGLQASSPEGALAAVAGLVMDIGVKCGLALAAMAGADYLYQRRSYETSLRMSREELKEEMRGSEGDPHLKGKLRQVARQLAKRRMMHSVPHADVVVTNPTHFAVAIEYKAEKMPAPVVTAKGQMLLAEQIKRIAAEHGVPVVENPPVARALYRSVEIGDAIPPALYQAVAEVLAFVYRMRDRASASG